MSLASQLAQIQALQNQGKPVRPEYETLLGDDGNLVEQYRAWDPDSEYRVKQIELLDRLGADANSDELSTLAQALMNSTDAQSAATRDKSLRQNASATEQQLSQMQMRGGSTGGAAERMANNASNRAMMVNQDLNQQADINRLNIMGQDAQYKQGLLGNLVDAYGNREQTDAKIQDLDRSRAMQEHKYSHDSEMKAYDSEMQAWAANKQANAQANAGKK